MCWKILKNVHLIRHVISIFQITKSNTCYKEILHEDVMHLSVNMKNCLIALIQNFSRYPIHIVTLSSPKEILYEDVIQLSVNLKNCLIAFMQNFSRYTIHIVILHISSFKMFSFVNMRTAHDCPVTLVGFAAPFFSFSAVTCPKSDLFCDF